MIAGDGDGPDRDHKEAIIPHRRLVSGEAAAAAWLIFRRNMHNRNMHDLKFQRIQSF